METRHNTQIYQKNKERTKGLASEQSVAIISAKAGISCVSIFYTTCHTVLQNTQIT